MEVRIVKKKFQFVSCWIAYVDNKPMAVFNSFQEAVKQLTECKNASNDRDVIEAIDDCLSVIYSARRIAIKELEDLLSQL